MTWSIKAREAAALLGINENTLYRWLNEQRLPGRKIKGKWIIPREELLVFLGEKPELAVAEAAE